MGGNVSNDLLQVGLGFAGTMGEMKMAERIKQKQQQQAFTTDAIGQLAAMGSLSDLDPAMQQAAQKVLGKDIFNMAMGQNNINRAIGQARKGAQNLITQEQVTKPAYEISAAMPGATQGMQGPPTAQQVANIPNITTTRQLTPEESFQKMNEIGPLGVYLLTGNIQAGQLAQQQSQLAFDRLKNRQAPGRVQSEAIVKLQADLAKKNQRSVVTTPEQMDQILNNGGAEQGMIGFRIGDAAMLIESPQDAIKIKEDVQTRLAGMGYKDSRKASAKDIQKAIQDSVKDTALTAGASAREKAKLEKEMAQGARLWDVHRPRAESTFDRETGQLAPSSLTVKDADNKKWKVIPDKHRGALQDVQTARASMTDVVKGFQSLYGKGGVLANIKATLPSRTKAGAMKYWNSLTQQNPQLAALQAQAGQIAQALNRGSYGGVGTQTENDRLFAMRALTSIADGSFLLDTPAVQQKKINDIMRRFNRIEGQILGNAGKDFPGTIYMDVKKPANTDLAYTTPPITMADVQEQQQNQQAQQPQAMQGEQQAASPVNNIIAETAQTSGIPLNYMQTMAKIESNNDPDATSPTGAKGLFQFTKATGEQYGLVGEGFDNRNDPKANAEAAAKLTADNFRTLQQQGIKPVPWLLYMAHQQGAGGVNAIINAARSGTDVPPDIRRNMDVNGGKGMSPLEFLQMWQQKWAKAGGQ